jgi:hypothetical protein
LQLVVEVIGGVGEEARLQRFTAAFDDELKKQNVDYTTKRTDSFGMTGPTVSVVPAGTFHRWMESRGKLGGQNKCPRCANHREILEAVVGFAAKRVSGETQEGGKIRV